MKTEYDFSNSKKNPYAKSLKKQITIRLDTEIITYFQELAEENAGIIPYQHLINLYLRDCATKHKKLQMTWKAA